MDLGYGETVETFREEVRAFLRAHWDREADRSDEAAIREFRKQATSTGLLNRHIPEAYGGSEQPPDPLKAAVIREEFSSVRAPREAAGIGQMLLVPTLLEWGTDWQKEQFIRPTIEGEIQWCQGYSEPEAGSDLASLRTRAVLENGEWVINGQKIWTSGALESDYMFCLARTEPDESKHAGISYLLLEMDQPGVEVRPLRQINGSSEFNEVFFTDARCPADWIVGRRGEGWRVSRTTLKHERDGIGAAAQLVRQFDALVDLARHRRLDGAPALDDPTMRQSLAELEGYVRAHEYSGYLQTSKSLKAESAGPIQLMNKLNSTNITSRMATIAMELLGDDALVAPTERSFLGDPKGVGSKVTESIESRWAGLYLTSLGGAIAGGTANIQRNVIAERGLGLPRDRTGT